MRTILAAGLALLALAAPLDAQPTGDHWVVSWAASAHGPYPLGNPAAQPDLSAAFPDPSVGARDQALRLIIRPTLWGRQIRIRLSNAFGSRAVTFSAVHVGLHENSSAVVAGTNHGVTFGGRTTVDVPAGGSVWSDPVDLSFVREANAEVLAGRKLAVSFMVVGESGPMTWHAKALQTSYVSRPGSGDPSDAGEAAFSISTTSWYFLDALEVMAPADAYAVVALGDSITDGSLSTLNGDDRWPDVLARRLRASGRRHVAVVNAGIGGNRVLQAPSPDGTTRPLAGGPSALERLERDVTSLSGVRVVLWLEGINDLSTATRKTAAEVMEGLRTGVSALRARIPGVRVIGATLTSARGSASVDDDGERERQRLNALIRGSRVFDGVADFDAATADPRTGALRAEFLPNTTVGGAGDRIHPNRLGYLAMGAAIELALIDVR